MITAILVENLRGWRGRHRVELGQLSITYGANSSGKSSLWLVLDLLRQSLRNADHGSHELVVNGALARGVGDFHSLVYAHNTALPVVLGFECEARTEDTSLGIQRRLAVTFEHDERASSGGRMTKLEYAIGGHARTDWARSESPSHAVDGLTVELRRSGPSETEQSWRIVLPYEEEVAEESAPTEEPFGLHSIMIPRTEAALMQTMDATDDTPEEPENELLFGAATGAFDDFCSSARFYLHNGYPTRVEYPRRTSKPTFDDEFTDPDAIPHIEEARQAILIVWLHFMEELQSEFSLPLDGLRHLRASRKTPPPIAHRSSSSPSTSDVGVRGENLLGVLSDKDNLKRTNLALQAFSNGKFPYEVRLDSFSDNEAARALGHVLILSLRDRVADTYIQADTVGSGVSQLVPIVAQLVSDGWVSTVVEEPELHLHPPMTLDVAQLLIDVALDSQGRRQVIVETHDHLILARVRRLLRTSTDRALAERVRLLYVSRNRFGSAARTFMLNADGTEPDDGGLPTDLFFEAFEEDTATEAPARLWLRHDAANSQEPLHERSADDD